MNLIVNCSSAAPKNILKPQRQRPKLIVKRSKQRASTESLLARTTAFVRGTIFVSQGKLLPKAQQRKATPARLNRSPG